ncbi:hypothetical protein K440DRAFT_633423 [Wilcoxina mikolae CBS 423.85]|nr:hypothetical protein K440DRAFT_633423 [Wilcoxina mikolae CBS 423.85]
MLIKHAALLLVALLLVALLVLPQATTLLLLLSVLSLERSRQNRWCRGCIGSGSDDARRATAVVMLMVVVMRGVWATEQPSNEIAKGEPEAEA